MKDPLLTYLQKRSMHHSWPWISGNFRTEALVQAVVIPVLAESANLFFTLSDLAANSPAMLEKTVVLCVVNNRTPDHAAEGDVADNALTLATLPAFAAAHPALRLAWIDAATGGREMGPKDGVGLARKIGMDWALNILHESQSRARRALICLDADTRVETNYLATLHDFFQTEPRWAAVVDYAHPIDDADDAVRPILSYELFLRYQELAWRFAGSPYAYPAIGSTMLCTPEAYAASGGMNRRQAGEDFYFLQQLVKTGRVDRVRGTTVMPSGRPSHRVPFGTGRKVGQFNDNEDDAYLTYHAETWTVLRAWLALVHRDLGATGASILSGAREIHPELAVWLTTQDFVAAWDRILSHSKDPAQRLRQFHGWFDAFRTLKLTHHLRDNGLPRQDLFEALGTILDGLKIPAPVACLPPLRHDLNGQRALVRQLRL